VDRGILVTSEEDVQPLDVAKILKNIIATEKPDFVIMGKQAIDDDCNQTGQMLAALLGWPQTTFASKITLTQGKAEVQREVDAGMETLIVKLPAVITTDLRLNEPRYPALPNIMKARSKPIDKKTPQDLNVTIAPRLRILKVEEPPKRVGGGKVANVAELVSKLKEVGVL
jgi:electron transfer flavoprotein beta subunit